jgi:type II secretory pathway pseudopilin PulG
MAKSKAFEALERFDRAVNSPYMDIESRLQQVAELYNEAIEAARRQNAKIKFSRKNGLISLVTLTTESDGEVCVWSPE